MLIVSAGSQGVDLQWRIDLEEIPPRAIARAERERQVLACGHDNGAWRCGLDRVGVQRELLAAANQDILREHACRPGDFQSRGDLARTKTVRDAHDRATRGDDPQIDRDGLGGHRHENRQRIAGLVTASREIRGDATGQRFQLAIAHDRQSATLGLVNDGRRIGRRGKAACHDVQPRAGQPLRRFDAPR